MKIHLTHSIDAGHRIVGHKGKCSRLHGHTYKFEIELVCGVSEMVEPGFVADFGDIKAILDEWDHRMLLWDEDPGVWNHPDHAHDDYGVVRLPFNPTAENMAHAVATRLHSSFPHIHSATVRVWETPKAYAEAIR